MLYRPNFCCHCGEKITRSKWLPWTSRRFCEFCQVEQMQHELLPKVCVVIALLVGAAGTISYFGGSTTGESSAANAAARLRKLPDNHPLSAPADQATSVPQSDAKSPSTNREALTKLQRGSPPESSTEAVYYCGAITRKGTPCTRRVKTAGRCWQHADQPVSKNDTKQPSRR
jgi:hypothetical protein